jgi:hypothetical protein
MMDEPRIWSDKIESRGSFQERAALFEMMKHSDILLESLVSDEAVSVAVVGNSPCEIGCRAGALIDAHDVVIRFNRFATGGTLAADYGTKTTIEVRAFGAFPAEEEKPNTRPMFLTGHNIMLRQLNWDRVLRHWRAKRAIAQLPSHVYRYLIATLNATPSAGLVVLYALRQLRGKLKRNSVFGFSLIDQIQTRDSRAHYFDSEKASSKHDWRSERVVFDSLFDSNGKDVQVENKRTDRSG